MSALPSLPPLFDTPDEPVAFGALTTARGLTRLVPLGRVTAARIHEVGILRIPPGFAAADAADFAFGTVH